jgi:holin-like protein
MKTVKQIGLLFLLCLIGEAISRILPFTLPGSLIGLFLLFALYLSGVIKKDALDGTGDFLLSNMMLFFIPATVSLMTVFELLAKNFFAIFVICITTTIITFLVTAYTAKLVMALQKRLGGQKNG